MKPNIFKTSDLGIAAFLLCKNIKLISAKKLPGRYEFLFDNASNNCMVYAIEYVNSDCSKFDAQIKNLKNILNSS